MENLILRIAHLEAASSPLEPTQSQRHDANDLVEAFADQFVNDISESRAYLPGEANMDRLKLDGRQETIAQILKIYRDEVVGHGINPASGGHLGYIPGGGIYLSAIADYLADVTNEYSGMYFASPGAVTIENEIISWTSKLFGFPEDTPGNLTSGGSIANLIALTAARDHHKIKGARIEQSVIYLSEQVHHCIYKALRIIGLEDIQIRHIKLDEWSRIDTQHLKDIIAADKLQGLNPFLLIASAGTTDTGAIDPLKEIGGIAKENGMWYHVDAAYGGYFVMVESQKDKFVGIEMADSLVVDPHKGLFLPYGLGVVLVKNLEALMHSHHYRANYMQDATSASTPINPADVSPELTKHFRGLRMWLPLKVHGIEPFVACLEEKILLTHYFRLLLEQNGFEIGPEPDLSVSYFWFPSDKTNHNAYNQQLMELLHEDGRVFLSSTIINGRFVIRIALLAFRTKKATVDKAMKMILEAKNRLDQQFSKS